MAVAEAKLTYDDYRALPEDDGLHYELIDGVLFVNAAPIPRHQLICGNLFVILAAYVRKHRCGEIYFAPLDVLLSEHDVVQPDILYLTKENAASLNEKNLKGAPDFAAEVLSDGTKNKDEVLKLERYETFGVREYWIADPRKERIRVHRRSGGRLELAREAGVGEVLTSPLFAGLEIAVADVFASF